MDESTPIEGPRLLAVLAGKVVTRTDSEGEWATGLRNHPISGRVMVTRLGIDGDEQANTKHHGGVDKALLGYSAEHYPRWNDELATTIPVGAFGENMLISGLDERNVRLGDRYRIGEVVAEVSQPRTPCWKLGRLWDIPTLAKLVVGNNRCGWYLRVIEEGTISPSELPPVELLARPYPDWTIERANDVYYRRVATDDGEQLARELIALRELSDAWRNDLRKAWQIATVD